MVRSTSRCRHDVLDRAGKRIQLSLAVEAPIAIPSQEEGDPRGPPVKRHIWNQANCPVGRDREKRHQVRGWRSAKSEPTNLHGSRCHSPPNQLRTAGLQRVEANKTLDAHRSSSQENNRPGSTGKNRDGLRQLPSDGALETENRETAKIYHHLPLETARENGLYGPGMAVELELGVDGKVGDCRDGAHLGISFSLTNPTLFDCGIQSQAPMLTNLGYTTGMTRTNRSRAPQSADLHIRVSTSDKETFTQAAEAAGLSLSAWLVRAGLGEIAREKVREAVRLFQGVIEVTEAPEERREAWKVLEARLSAATVNNHGNLDYPNIDAVSNER